MCYINEPSQVWNAKILVARKPHWCNECYATTIAKGERYERVGSLFDHEWTTFRTCSQCLLLRAAVQAHEIAEGCSQYEATPPVGYLARAAYDSWVATHQSFYKTARDEALVMAE